MAERITPCPRSPNCVSTLAEEESSHRMEPWPLEVSPQRALELLVEILSRRPRTDVVERDASAPRPYLHATERSAIFRFTDDLEIEIDPEAREVHFRSASRLGWSDLGVNRRRMEKIGAEFLARQRDETA